MPAPPAGILKNEVTDMDAYPTLRDLLENDPASRALFARFTRDEQVALQEQRQDIRTYADLESAAASFERRGGGR